MKMNVKRHAPLVLALALYALDPTAFGLFRSVNASPQTFVTPKGEAQNVRFEQREGGTVHILFDLVASDPRAVFSVMLDASTDSGTTWSLRPQSVTGDTGDSVTAGLGKRIVWDSGKDVERVQIDRIRFRIVATAGPLKLETRLPLPNIVVGGLAVMTTPAGAQVTVDGTPRGVTPLTLRDLTPGDHRVIVAKAGYLENSQTVDVMAGKEAKVDVALTTEARAAQATGTPTHPAKTKGGGAKWLLIGGGVAAAAAGAVVAGGGGAATTAGGGNFPFQTNGTVIATNTSIGQSSDHSLGPSPRDGVVNARLTWAPAAFMIFRLAFSVDGDGGRIEPLSCAFFLAPDCASTSSINASRPVRKGQQVQVFVISFSNVPASYALRVEVQ